MMSIKYSNHFPTSLSEFSEFSIDSQKQISRENCSRSRGEINEKSFLFSFRKQTILKQTQSRSTIFLNCRTNNINNNNNAGRTRSWLDGERVASIKLPGAGGHQRPDHLSRHHDQQHIRIEVAADS